ncbi:MAG: hypothetical protein GY861_22165 [bacterium]|nr:hypothetical protein [bacterium]
MVKHTDRIYRELNRDFYLKNNDKFKLTVKEQALFSADTLEVVNKTSYKRLIREFLKEDYPIILMNEDFRYFFLTREDEENFAHVDFIKGTINLVKGDTIENLRYLRSDLKFNFSVDVIDKRLKASTKAILEYTRERHEMYLVRETIT